MNEELRNALVAAREGDEGRARLLLAEYLRREPNNVAAWVLLSKLAATEVQRAAFLRKVLDLDPEHAYARQALQQMGQAPAPVISPQSGASDAAFDTPPPSGGVDNGDDGQTDASFDFDFEEEAIAADEGAQAELSDEDSSAIQLPPMPAVESQEHERWPASHVADDLDAQAEGDAIPPWVDVDETMFETPARPEAYDESEDELPEWLREEGGDEWLDEETEARYAERAPDSGNEEESAAAEKESRLAAAMAAQTPAVVTDTEPDTSRNWLLPLLIVVAVAIFLVLVYLVLTNFL